MKEIMVPGTVNSRRDWLSYVAKRFDVVRHAAQIRVIVYIREKVATVSSIGSSVSD